VLPDYTGLRRSLAFTALGLIPGCCAAAPFMAAFYAELSAARRSVNYGRVERCLPSAELSVLARFEHGSMKVISPSPSTPG